MSTYSNRNSRIITQRRDGAIETRTARRGRYSMRANIITDGTKFTSLRLRFFDGEFGDAVFLTGREARTIYRLLKAHYNRTQK